MTDLPTRLHQSLPMMTAGPRFVAADRARPRAVRQLLPPRAHDALSRQRHRACVGARASARAAGRLSLRVHDGVPRRQLRRQELPAVRRRRALAVARGAGSASAGDRESRRLRRADPQGRVSARDRSSTRRSPRRSRCSSRATSSCSRVLEAVRRAGAPRRACCSPFRCGSCWRSRSPGSRSRSRRCRCSCATSSTC